MALQFLASDGYGFSHEAAYADYVRRYCRANDGMSHKRVADLMDSVKAGIIRGVRKTGVPI